jgi:hypothetical protein
MGPITTVSRKDLVISICTHLLVFDVVRRSVSIANIAFIALAFTILGSSPMLHPFGISQFG